MTLERLLGRVALVSGLAFSSYNCQTESAPACVKDTDCKGERVCVQGVCQQQSTYGGADAVVGFDTKKDTFDSCTIKEGPDCEDFTGCYIPTPETIPSWGNNKPVCIENHPQCKISMYSFNDSMELTCHITCGQFKQITDKIPFQGNSFLDPNFPKRYVLCGQFIYGVEAIYTEGTPLDLSQPNLFTFKKTNEPIKPNNCCN